MDDDPLPPRRPVRSSGRPPTRPPTRPPDHRGRSVGQKVLLVLGILLVVGIASGVAGAGYLWYRYNQIGREDLDLPTAATEEPRNYLIVGSDTRDSVSADDPDAQAFIGGEAENAGHRSDTIIVLRVDPTTESITMISFPRDLWVPIAGTTTTEKINAAYNGGPQRLVDTIKQNFDIDIHHYVEIDFSSFKGIVDAVDGVPMYFDRPMRDENSGLYVYETGCVTLDGEQALAFSRARHLEVQDSKGRWTYDGTGDLGRVARQQVFMRKVIDRAAGQLSGFDLKAANDLLSSTADNLTVDSAMDIGHMVDLGRQFSDFSGDKLVTLTLPVEEWTGPGGTSALKLDQAAAQPVLNVFRGLPADDLPPSAVTLVVQNGSGVSGQAKAAGDALAALGFVVESTGNAPANVPSTVVRYAPGAEARAVAVAEHLPVGTRLEVDRNLAAGKVVVVTGVDFTPASVSATTVPVEAPPTTTAATGGTAAVTGSSNPDVIDQPIGIVPHEDPAAAC